MDGMTTLKNDQLETGAFASLAFGIVGDAMGTPTENLEPEQIQAKFGWVETFEGDGTGNDFIMRNLIADALLATDGYADADSWGDLMDAPAQGDLRPEGRALLPVGAAFRGQAALRRQPAAHYRHRQHAEAELGDGDRTGRHRQCRPSARRRGAGDGAGEPDPCHRRRVLPGRRGRHRGRGVGCTRRRQDDRRGGQDARSARSSRGAAATCGS